MLCWYMGKRLVLRRWFHDGLSSLFAIVPLPLHSSAYNASITPSPDSYFELCISYFCPVLLPPPFLLCRWRSTFLLRRFWRRILWLLPWTPSSIGASSTRRWASPTSLMRPDPPNCSQPPLSGQLAHSGLKVSAKKMTWTSFLWTRELVSERASERMGAAEQANERANGPVL